MVQITPVRFSYYGVLYSPTKLFYAGYSLSIMIIVTGSAKTRHNRTSLNLQYKALNTLGAYLHIVEKIL